MTKNETFINSGFIQLHRNILEWEWYQNINTKTLFIHCLLKANFQEKKWQGMIIPRGSFVTSYEKLSKETGLTIQNVRTSLNHLKSTSELTIKKTNKYQVISIAYYDKYQSANNQTNNQLTINQQTTNNQLTTTNNDNKENNDNNINQDGFNLFWDKYPRKISKAQSLKCYAKAVKETSKENILTGLEKYKLWLQKNHTEEQFIKHPSTWLNQKCYLDDYGFDKVNPIATRELHGLEKLAIEENRELSFLEKKIVNEWLKEEGINEVIC